MLGVIGIRGGRDLTGSPAAVQRPPFINATSLPYREGQTSVRSTAFGGKLFGSGATLHPVSCALARGGQSDAIVARRHADYQQGPAHGGRERIAEWNQSDWQPPSPWFRLGMWS